MLQLCIALSRGRTCWNLATLNSDKKLFEPSHSDQLTTHQKLRGTSWNVATLNPDPNSLEHPSAEPANCNALLQQFDQLELSRLGPNGLNIAKSLRDNT